MKGNAFWEEMQEAKHLTGREYYDYWIGKISPTEDEKATRALQVYGNHADEVENGLVVEKLMYFTDCPDLNLDACMAYCKENQPKVIHTVSKAYTQNRYSLPKFMQFIAEHFGVTTEQMKRQWKNIKTKQ